jgi:hypothetical protein
MRHCLEAVSGPGAKGGIAERREILGDCVIQFTSCTPTDAVEWVLAAMIKHGVRSCPLNLMCFTANFAVRASPRCVSNSCFGLAPL